MLNDGRFHGYEFYSGPKISQFDVEVPQAVPTQEPGR